MYRTARLSPRTRAFLVDEASRIGPSRTAHNNGTSRRTVYRWRRRQGAYDDRSSRPHRSPRRTPDPIEAAVLGLRLELRWGPDLLGPYLDLHPSTVHRILRRHTANRPVRLFPKAPRSFGRFDIRQPGELVAMDIKSMGRLERGGGRRPGRPGAGQLKVGWQHLHVAIDLASRVVYAELRAGMGKADTMAFLAQALAFFFDAKGIRVRRVLTDNGSGYKRSLSERCQTLGLRQTRTKPYHPWTNGRVERFIGTIQRECLYAGELHSDEERALVIALYLAYCNSERPHTRLGGLPPLEWLGQ
ncbi:MAG TPA: IS481 family transposase [Candidatus Limnocylindria bacterium]|jgi:transposase InsO family protein|nr:IS481 family transposase [Candidatus Limnocylindria bacterium]